MRKKLLISMAIMSILIGLLAGCALEDSTVTDTEVVAETIAESVEKVDQSDDGSIEQTGEAIVESELRFKTITDMAGREVTIPIEIDKIYGVNNNATFILYTLVPEKLIGWNLKLSEVAVKYIEEPYKKLPVVGSLYGNGKLASVEEILVYEPDVIFLSDRSATDKCIQAAEALQSTMEIPVVIIENGISSYDEAYTLLGEVFGVEDRAAALAGFYLDSYEYALANKPSEEEQKTVYYARTKDGLGTDFAGSYHTEILDLIGAMNVAENGDSESKEQSGSVTIEQIMVWDPQVIIVGQQGVTQDDTHEIIMTDVTWSGIDAVMNQAVYDIPNKPFNWFDRPPSVNRVIGIKYIGHLVYPEIYDIDIKAHVKNFFQLYYRYDLSDEEVDTMLGK